MVIKQSRNLTPLTVLKGIHPCSLIKALLSAVSLHFTLEALKSPFWPFFAVAALLLEVGLSSICLHRFDLFCVFLYSKHFVAAFAILK